MDLFGLKWAIIIGEIGYIFYIAANIKPLPILMYISKYSSRNSFEKKIQLILQVLHLLEYVQLHYGQLKLHISIKSLDIILNITNKLMAYLLVYSSEYSLLSLERIPSGEISYPISF